MKHSRKFRILICFAFIIFMTSFKYDLLAQNTTKTLTQEMLWMPRSKMYLEDEQLLLFNGNGFVNFIGYKLPNGKTISQENIYFPIPQSEIDVNPSLAGN